MLRKINCRMTVFKFVEKVFIFFLLEYLKELKYELFVDPSLISLLKIIESDYFHYL